MEEFLQVIIKDSELARRIVIGGFWYSGGSLLFVLGVLIRFWSNNITGKINETKSGLNETKSELTEYKKDNDLRWREFERDCRARHNSEDGGIIN